MKNLRDNLGEGCVDFSSEDEDFYENIALCDEMSMEKYNQIRCKIN